MAFEEWSKKLREELGGYPYECELIQRAWEAAKEEQADNLNRISKAFFDVLDGSSSWWDIRADTGLPEERCREIEEIFKEVSNDQS